MYWQQVKSNQFMILYKILQTKVLELHNAMK